MLLIESPGQKEKGFLSNLNYRCFAFIDGALIENRPSYNVFFIPDEMMSSLRAHLRVQEVAPEKALE